MTGGLLMRVDFGGQQARAESLNNLGAAYCVISNYSPGVKYYEETVKCPINPPVGEAKNEALLNASVTLHRLREAC